MKIKLTIILFFVFAQFIGAQESDMKKRTVGESTGIISGRLENGFRYFIKPLDNDKGKIHTRLIVNVGSSQESKDQYSSAHLLEHLAFNGTENFPSLRNNPEFYTQLKMEPRDLHAHMGANKTEYNIEFPQEVTKALDTSLAVYHDIASGKVLFKEKAVEGERKAVHHEGDDGTDPGVYYPFLKIYRLLTNCGYMPSLEKEKEATLNSSTKALKQFYNDWYRPDLMSLIIIGNIKNPKEVEEKIIEKFKNLPRSINTLEKKDCEKSYLTSSKKFIVEDDLSLTAKKSYAQTSFEFYYRNPTLYFKEFSKNENELIWEIISTLIDARLKSEQLNYGINYTSYMFANNSLPAIKLGIKTTGNEENTIKRVYKVLASTSYGFQKEEWQKLMNKKIEYLTGINFNSPEFWSDALENHLVEGSALPNPNDQIEIEFLKALDPEKLNQLLKEINWKPDDITMVIPKNVDRASLTRSRIENWIEDGLKNPEKFVAIKTPEHLLVPSEISELNEAKIVDKRYGDFNEDIIKLENGVKIILKDIKPEMGRNKDKIMIHGFSPYGATCFGARDMETLFSPFIIKNSGAGKYNKFEIDQFLSTTSIPFGIRNYIEQTETGIQTEVSPEDLEIALQLIYLNFNEPRFDKSAFEDWKIQEADHARRHTNPNKDFIDFINEKSGIIKIPKGSRRYRQSLNLNYKQAFEKYKALHANARDFIFILTGDFKKGNALPLLQKYLGNLKNTDQKEFCKNYKHNGFSHLSLSDEDEKLVFSYPTDNTVLYTQYKSDWIPGDVKEEIRFQFLISAIDQKLKDLRYKKNYGTYFAVASALYNYQDKKKFLQMLVHTTPKDFEKVLLACNKYIEDLKSNTVSDEFLRMAKKTAYLPKWQERSENTNRSMQMRLYSHYRYEIPFTDLQEIQKYMDEFTVIDLQETANEYLKEEHKKLLTASGPTE